jgi:hypothetical protein
MIFVILFGDISCTIHLNNDYSKEINSGGKLMWQRCSVWISLEGKWLERKNNKRYEKKSVITNRNNNPKYLRPFPF